MGKGLRAYEALVVGEVMNVGWLGAVHEEDDHREIGKKWNSINNTGPVKWCVCVWCGI